MLAQLIVQIPGDPLLFVLDSGPLSYLSLKEGCLLLHRHLQSVAVGRKE